MTVSSGFFNSVNHDRLYNAEQLSSIFDGIIVDGVYENYGEAFMVTANPDANSSVIIGTGRAWFDHTWTLNDSQFAMQLDPPNELLGRIDAIVIDIDRTQSVRKNSIIYVKGDEASPDFPPSLIHEERHKQYPIAYITRHAEVNSPISQSDISIVVGTANCPIVTGVLESQNLENLIKQLDSEFNEWWDGIKETLDENVATNLQNQIDEINEKLNGEGSLVGLMTKPVFDLFKLGDYGVSASGATLKAGNTTPPDTDETISHSQVWCSYLQDQYPNLTLLPNGKAMLIHAYSLSSTHYFGIRIIFFNKNGTATYKYHSLGNTNNFGTSDHEPYTWSSLGGNYDSFPVTSYISINNDRGAGTVAVYKITISSSETISVEETKFDQPFGSGAKWSSVFWSYMTQLTDNGSGLAFGIAFSRGFDDQLSPAILVKRNSAGVSAINANDKLWLNDVSLMESTVYTDDYVAYATTGGWIIQSTKAYADPYKYAFVSEEDLSVTNYDIAYPGTLDPYRIEHETSTYSMSESEGFSSLTMKRHEDISGQKERISDYFCAANNSGNGLPEGTFIGLKKDSVYVGSGPSGEQIAIGSNGGAAILKKKVPFSVSLNASNIVVYNLGDVTLGDTRYYLMYKKMDQNNLANVGSIVTIKMGG